MAIRGLPRRAVLAALVVATLLLTILYYSRKVNQLNSLVPVRKPLADNSTSFTRRTEEQPLDVVLKEPQSSSSQECRPVPKRSAADMETVDILPTLNFEAEWIERREYWNDHMQKRYERRRRDMWSKVPLRVFVVPHSHNDPGWLKTFEGYFNTATRTILDGAVDKMTKYKDLTFVWTEMAYLSKWYETAHDERKANLQHLLEEGRFEILTGGWVMTDEANVDTFGMVDQLVEGHQWMLNYLNVTAKSSWSVDPFGHGGTFPYLLQASGITGMMIMRIHYAWKEWFAREQQGDFLWSQQWDSSGKHSILCHNFPYDIYTVKESCGPHKQICLEFNYRKVPGDYGEYAARYTPVHGANVKERAELLLDQYGKTGSLFPHNVVLAPLGDDFVYSHEIEWDQQYSNYKLLMDFINQGDYNAEVTFGTLSDYFEEVRRRTSRFDTLNGDFFVYSDIFSEGRPAYWSGYFTTRPFMKLLSRELGQHLRATEILFTHCYHIARQRGEDVRINQFATAYAKLITARRNFALFQHHDAITGTSKQAVMHDYALKLFDSLQTCRGIEKLSFQFLLGVGTQDPSVVNVVEDFEWPSYQIPPSSLPLNLDSSTFLLVFNPLAETRTEVISFFTQTTDVCIKDPDGKDLDLQVNPTWNASSDFNLDTHFVEVTFLATLTPLTLSRFSVSKCERSRERTRVFCLHGCNSGDKYHAFEVAPKPEGQIRIESSELLLAFHPDSLLLDKITHKRSGRSMPVALEFAAYPTAQFRNGAYLFKTDSRMPENIAIFGEKDLKECVVVSGPIFYEVTLLFKSGTSRYEPAIFAHTVRLFHSSDNLKNRGVYIENNFNFGGSENHNDVDLFMRFRSSVKNGVKEPTFYTDMNGFQMEKRRIVRQINIEGNYYPITSMAYIEDRESRLTLLVDHAMGATSWQQGWLEVMVDRRSTFDDARGMGEGVLDNRETKHRYWLLFEPKLQTGEDQENLLSLPSQVASALSRHLNHPPVRYVGRPPPGKLHQEHHFRSRVELGTDQMPCDAHLFNLRTLSDSNFPTTPSRAALLILHSQPSDCDLAAAASCQKPNSSSSQPFNLTLRGGLVVKRAVKTSLTGVIDQEDLPLDSLDKVTVNMMTLEALKLFF